MVVQAKSLLDAVVLRNGGWSFDVTSAVIDADFDASVDQVTQLTIEIDDPAYRILGNSSLPVGAPIDFQGARLAIAAIETGEGGGEGGFQIVARPRIVRALKDRRGAHTMSNVSPTQYVESEVRAVGGGVFAQPSAKRNQIARDVKQPGTPASEDDASAWSTIKRLADELGYLCYESNGTIYFGQPSWLVAQNQRVNVYWNTNRESRGPYHLADFPKFRQSVDDDNKVTVTLKVPVEQSAEFRPGYAVDIKGMPRFGGIYLIREVSFPLVSGEDEMMVVAETPKNPTPTGTTT